MHTKVQIICKNNKPYGIRDDAGFLFFFTKVSKFQGQEERYRQELEEQFTLADYLLTALQERGQPTPNAAYTPRQKLDGTNNSSVPNNGGTNDTPTP